MSRQSTTSSTIRQRYLQIAHHRKFDAMTRILESEGHEGVIAFVRTRAGTEELAQRLIQAGFKAVAISGDIQQKQREKTVEDLKSGRVDILVATDVAARGLDVERISHVINYDIPQDAESYVHRIGRTGRAGRTGDAILFMTPRERFLLKQIERTTRQEVEEMSVPTVAQVNEARKGKIADTITVTLDKADARDLDTFADIVEKYVATTGVDATRVAAALAIMAQGGRPLLSADQEIPQGGPLRRDRDEQGGRGARGGRDDAGDGRGSRGPRREPAAGNATYWIGVGHTDRVKPGNIVGALANEVGLAASQIGAIDLRGNHALVELPADLTPAQLEKASTAEINGRRLNLRKDSGRPTRGEGEREERGGRGGFQKERGGFRKGGDDRGGRGGFRKDSGGERGGERGGARTGGFRKSADERGGERTGGFRPSSDGAKKSRWGSNDRRERDDRGPRR